MKKIFAIILTLFLIITTSISVNAIKDPDTFYIEELKLSINVPLYHVATRTENNFDMDPENYKEAVEDFEQKNIYLWGVSKFYNQRLFLYGLDANVRSLELFNEKELNDVANNIKSNLEAQNYTIVKSDIIESYNATYVITHYYDTEENYAISYSTVKDYKDIVLTMWSYEGEPTADQRQKLISIITSIEFDADKQSSETYPSKNQNETTENNTPNNISKYYTTKSFPPSPIVESLIITAVAVLIQIIAGIVILIVFVNKAKKRRNAALSAETVQSDSKFCIYCGAELKAVDTFCHKCGNKQAASNTNENTDI